MKDNLKKAINRIKSMYHYAIKQMLDPYFQGFAGQVGYYLLLSVVPTILVLSQILGLLDISMESIKSFLLKYVQTDMAENIIRLMSGPSSIGINIFLIAVAIWAASRAIFAMSRITNYTMTDGETSGSYWPERVRSLFTIMVVMVLAAASLVILVFGEQILEISLGRIIQNSDVIVNLWLVIRWPIALALYIVIIGGIYYVMPKQKVRIRDIIPGTLVACIGLVLVTYAYSAYVSFATNYDIIYGSLSSIVALLFWFYFLAWVIWIGVLVNKSWIDSRERELSEEEKRLYSFKSLLGITESKKKHR
ncbi:MAG: YihY/virulence factor BrkB family protein [Clostridia bacterium]|nr:YihY/virulence factor BrkB family protein [Clostridia bacterium]